MSEVADTTTEPADDRVSNATPAEGDIPDATPEGSGLESEPTEDAETFPRNYVEKLRQENGRYRQRASEADSLANRLHTELVRATGKLADPTDLPFNADHLADAGTMSAAIDALLEAKPHLAARRITGDIGQGAQGNTGTVSLIDILRGTTG
ncbi:hypothetical protein [Mycolicibacterium sp. NCC-Tsukiji]|uniref:hypothetical protein n=1 Tax=Mycolicibacterium sp. NCC-Tsukiji TaxID=2185272 RepID=UPI000EE6FBC0|nr:hypothetical protein [Mycolicibacterium sp. NCC-Tsukiji]GCA97172.1 hypothetical protein NCCNTM_08070 [Mycolicibacterium sp. NCC-Tsukiji]